MLMTGNWTKSMNCQPCDVEGEPIDGTELKEVRSLISLAPLSNIKCIFRTPVFLIVCLSCHSKILGE